VNTAHTYNESSHAICMYTAAPCESALSTDVLCTATQEESVGLGEGVAAPALATRQTAAKPPAIRAVQAERAELRERQAWRSGAAQHRQAAWTARCDERSRGGCLAAAEAGAASGCSETHGDVEMLRGTFKCHRDSLDFDFKFLILRCDCDTNGETQVSVHAREQGAHVGSCAMPGVWRVLGEGARERRALCTAMQRVGLAVEKAAHRDGNSLSPSRPLENRHDSGQDHHRPKAFRMREAGAADHSAEAAKPRRRPGLVGSTSYGRYRPR
jgi:hypothetical protein